MKDLEQLRARLPALRDVTYLNTGTLGVMAEPVLERYAEALQRVERFGHARWDEVRAIAEVARQRLAELVGACSEELAFTGNSTDGLALVLASLRWSPGDRVMTSDQEHPALLLPLSAVSRRHEVTVHQFTVGSTPEETIVSFAERLEEVRPRLVAFSHVSCETGLRLPVERLVSMAHEHGALVLLDVAQSVGQCRVDLRGLGVDFAAGNGHKWLHGPKGTGFLFV
jgi:selenocysteine lyase/cysteine desulfurase